jgi:hypothetical protein
MFGGVHSRAEFCRYFTARFGRSNIGRTVFAMLAYKCANVWFALFVIGLTDPNYFLKW